MTTMTLTSARSLLQVYVDGVRDFSNMALDLSQADLYGANLAGATFGPTTDFRHANLAMSNLEGVTFRHSMLGMANLRQANLRDTKFDHVEMPGANLSGADMQRAAFWSSNLRCSHMVHAIVAGALFDAVNMHGANLYGANLDDVTMRNCCILYRSVLAGASLLRASLDYAVLDLANLDGADLQSADLHGARLNGAILTDVRMNWSSRELVAEILRQAAAEAEHYAVVGWLMVADAWDWDAFDMLSERQAQWVFRVLAAYAKPGDTLPSQLQQALEKNQDGR